MKRRQAIVFPVVLVLLASTALGGFAHAAETAQAAAAPVAVTPDVKPGTTSLPAATAVKTNNSKAGYVEPPVEAQQTSGGIPFEQALTLAYENNPDLEASRAELRSVDELYAQAISGFRPVISGEASYQSTHQKGNNTTLSYDPKTIGVVLNQSLYSGGSTLARMDESDQIIKAQREILKLKEQDVLLQAITAYVDVVRDQEIIRLTTNNQNVLTSHLDESRQRFELGDITKTDVSQAESRLSAAKAARVVAEGNYRVSRAVFEAVIGASPDGLSQPQFAIEIPSTLEGALELAEKNNPNMLYVDHAEQAAKHSTRAIFGEMLPQVGLNGSIGKVYDPSQSFDDDQTQTSIGISATVPLYTGGGTDSRVRQAKQIQSQRRMESRRAERFVHQYVVDAWTALQAADAEIQARKSQIAAADLALEGVRVETEYGSRTTLDLLDAEQESLDAQVAYASAERNRIVAAYRVLAAIGELNAGILKLPTKIYDEKANFQKVKNKWIGTGTTTVEEAKGKKK